MIHRIRGLKSKGVLKKEKKSLTSLNRTLSILLGMIGKRNNGTLKLLDLLYERSAKMYESGICNKSHHHHFLEE